MAKTGYSPQNVYTPIHRWWMRRMAALSAFLGLQWMNNYELSRPWKWRK